MTKASRDNTVGKAAQDQPKTVTNGGNIQGEGNYSAARRFDAREGEFVEKNRRKIPGMGKDAEKALDGPEGDELRKAEDRARAHSHASRGEQ